MKMVKDASMSSHFSDAIIFVLSLYSVMMPFNQLPLKPGDNTLRFYSVFQLAVCAHFIVICISKRLLGINHRNRNVFLMQGNTESQVISGNTIT
jgi:hypothetical protein